MQIKNMESYCLKMKQSIYDKAFFIDKLYDPVDFIIDYGCADASLLKFINLIYPDCKFIGYDNNYEMLKKAQENFPKADYFSNWQDVFFAPNHSLLNLSSVIHEIYSYLPKNEVEEFWSRVFNSGFKYIAIREMAISKKSDHLTPIVNTIKVNSLYGKQVKEFENIWGTITENKNFIHFLLKYKYKENWDRELKENYLPLTVEEIINLIPDNYEIIFFEHRPLVYTAESIKEDLRIDFKDPTHVKILLKIKDN